MFEYSTGAFVYKFQDLTSNSVEYISIEELDTCDWYDKATLSVASA